MKQKILPDFSATLLLLCVLAGCSSVNNLPKLENNRELLPANVLELPNAGDLTLDEMETGVWIQLNPDRSLEDTQLLMERDTGPYRLGVGDELEITIYGYGEGENQRTLPIDPAGNITYMMVGTVPAAGRTIDELTEDMRARLSEELKYAILNITPYHFGSQTFTVLGQMKYPQVYPLEGRMRLLDALAKAGGTKLGEIRNVSADIHDLAHATLVRGGQVVPIDFEKLVYEADATQNLEIRSGDIIFVPSALERKIYALGSFNSPQGVQFAHSSLSLMNAVVQAGGMNTATSDGHILIIRGNTVRPKIMLMDMSQFDSKKARVFKIIGGRAMDVQLQPGDIVYAVPKKFSFAREVIKDAIRTFATTLTSDAATDIYQRDVDPFNFGTERPD
ncbi:MAG: polysaccharide export protein [Kiritimatiellales bacterium]|nr:polysaccharide export protein [Kiritimatiellota bacterium]MBL7012275.1 polysaccharide export protein [Kiritimatiellales bacterium]